MDQPIPIVAGLLAILALPLLIGGAFICVYRRHARTTRHFREELGLFPWASTSRKRTFHQVAPQRWLAIRAMPNVSVQAVLGPIAAPCVPWSEALASQQERRLFFSPAVDGWTLVIGAALPDPGKDIDALFHFLRFMSSHLGEVCFFSIDRVLGTHGWVRLNHGRIVRAYVWAGSTLWNEGRIGTEERELGLQTRAYCEQPEPVAFGEISQEIMNLGRILFLARRWSIDPFMASEIILHLEAVGSGGDNAQC